jgi:glycosyltransferase involved in cell wall biosynthesis
LTIIGTGNEIYRKYCEQLAATLGLSSVVTFNSNRPRTELIHRYQAADIFCMPSTETYGLAILEAMSSGCAVLVSDINGPGEIVQHGTGLKVPLVDPEQYIAAYADRIVQLVDDSQLREDLGSAARAHVAMMHNWSKIQSRLLTIYEEIFGNSHSTDQNELVQPRGVDNEYSRN